MSPYEALPKRNFWRTGVALQHPLLIDDLYQKKFTISRSARIATAGSCFAQHIGRYLAKSGFNVIDREPPPRGLDEAAANKFGYRLYSARYGNIYSIRQLKQLLLEALGDFEPADIVWRKGDRYFDALRPSVEPNGLGSADEVALHRRAHLKMIRTLLRELDLLVFTFGLTEAWIHSASGTVFPTAPGTIAGVFDGAKYSHKVFSYSEIMSDFLEVKEIIERFNPNVKFILTVSPVPLTATACPSHVLVATTNAKSTLRAVVGQLASDFESVDYFPSYELIASPFSRGFFYESNLREVSPAGVEVVMRSFFKEHGQEPLEEAHKAKVTSLPVDNPSRSRRRGGDRQEPSEKNNIVCEDILLEAFSR
jgi:hypothetical protein